MGMYAKYTPIRANFDLAPNLTPSDKKLGSTTLRVISGYFFYLSRPSLTPSDKKFLVIGQTSTSANELSRQWVVRFSTAHRLEIRRALYLQPSTKKLGATREVLVSLVPSDSYAEWPKGPKRAKG